MSEAGKLARLLAANPFFGGLGPDDLDGMASICVTRRIASGEVLFLKADPADGLYAVRRGQIRIGTASEDGRHLTLNILGPGDVFGEIALLDGRPRTADAIANEETELFMVPRHDFLRFLRSRPEVSIRVIGLLCERIRWMSDRMEETALLPLPVRLARRLIALEEDYGSDLDVSQEELAAFVGASRESVNRQLQVWRRKGLVELGRARIHLVDSDRLMHFGGTRV